MDQPVAHETMQKRWWKCLSTPATREAGRKDFIHTFTQIGLGETEAAQQADLLLNDLANPTQSLSTIEARIYTRLSQLKVGDRTLSQALDAKMTGRAEKIFGQIKDHVKGVNGEVLDFGCGDAQVTQMIADALKGHVTGADVIDYRADHTKALPFSLIKDKSRVDADPAAFELAILTNVMHHEADNEHILNELDRIVTNRLVIIETVPIGKDEKEMEADKDRTFMNDYFYNRLLHDPKINVPVPGTFETPKGWVERFTKHGWHVKYEEDLGIDQPMIHDRHYLLVLERDQKKSEEKKER